MNLKEKKLNYQKFSVHFSHSVMSNSLQPHGLQHARLPYPSPTPGVYKLMSVKSVILYNHLILCRPLLLPPSIFPRIRVFSNESVLHIRWPKYWSFSFSISPFNEYSGLISFRVDWLDLLAVQGTLKTSHDSCHCCLFLCTLSHETLTYLASEVSRKRKSSAASLSIWLSY